MERYKELHRSLDVLVADMITVTGKIPSKTTVMELMQWSAERLAAPEPDGLPPEGSTVAYSVGLVAMSVCALKDVTREQIEAYANARHPTGTRSRWAISEDRLFHEGKTMPCVCEDDSKRLHWLLNC